MKCKACDGVGWVFLDRCRDCLGKPKAVGCSTLTCENCERPYHNQSVSRDRICGACRVFAADLIHAEAAG